MSACEFTSIEGLKQLCKDEFNTVLLETVIKIDNQICDTAKRGEFKCTYEFELSKKAFKVILVETIVKRLKKTGYNVKIFLDHTIEIDWSADWDIKEILS